MTGCPNGCSRPYMAESGLVGSGVEQIPALAWRHTEPHRLATPYLERMR